MKRKRDRQIRVVATRELMIGDELKTPPADADPSRAETYAFDFPATAAATLARNKVLRPAHPADAHVLRSYGVDLASFYQRDRRLSPEPDITGDEWEPAEGEEGGDARSHAEIAQAALEDGRKASLVEALELFGLTPEEFKNNAERADALKAWAGGEAS